MKNEYYFCISFGSQEKFVRTNQEESEILIQQNGVWTSSAYPKPYPIQEEGEAIQITREEYEEKLKLTAKGQKPKANSQQLNKHSLKL
jgi:hypothetical protein